MTQNRILFNRFKRRAKIRAAKPLLEQQDAKDDFSRKKIKAAVSP